MSTTHASPVPRIFGLSVMAGVALATLVAAFLFFSEDSSAAIEIDPHKPTIVLVHGAWADASGWNDVIRKLQTEGYPTLAVGNPLRSLEGDSAYLASVLAQIPGDVVLVGHSYGGAVMTNAAADAPNVRALVYVAAFAPDIGEDVLHLAGEGSMIADSIEPRLFPPGGENDVELYISLANFREAFAGDIPAKQAAVMAVSQRPTALAAGVQPTFATAWKTFPSWYVLATQDNTITPDAQRFMAERAGATITEVKSSHVVMISKPDKVVDVIQDAVEATN